MTDTERKHTAICAASMLGLYTLGMLLLTVLVPCFMGLAEPLRMVVFGAVLMAMAIPCHILAGKLARGKAGHRWLYALPVFLNDIATALCAAAYYTHVGVRPESNEFLVGVAVVEDVCVLFSLLILLFPHLFRVFSVIFELISLGLLMTCIIFWVKGGVSAETAVWSFGFFLFMGLCTVIGAFFYACEDAELKNSPWVWMKYLSFASFGLFIVVGVVVLLILLCASGDGCDCDCDCCDCGDGGCGGNGKKGKQNTAKN